MIKPRLVLASILSLSFGVGTETVMHQSICGSAFITRGPRQRSSALQWTGRPRTCAKRGLHMVEVSSLWQSYLSTLDTFPLLTKVP